jgi:RNA polymerase sigma factor (sigma-70 family)
MIKEKVVTQESFNLLLDWLDKNRDAAGRKYEKIRQGLIRIYAGRGCFEAEELADEVINRVTRKLPEIIQTYIGEPVRYFYGVAENTYLEWLRKQKKHQTVELPELPSYDPSDPDDEYLCLEKCLKSLPKEHRELIVEYYQEEKSAKILHRQRLAAHLKLSLNGLQVRTSRIRAKLEGCVVNCVSANNQ